MLCTPKPKSDRWDDEIGSIKGKRVGQSEEELLFFTTLILKCIFQYWESIFPWDKDIRQNGKLSPNSIARDYTNTHSYWVGLGGVNTISVSRKYSEINIIDYKNKEI